MNKLSQQEIDESLEDHFGNDRNASIRDMLDKAAKQRKLSDALNQEKE